MSRSASNLASLSNSCSAPEWRMRLDLAACYRLAHYYRMGKVIWNHITARVPEEPASFLVFRLGCRYDEVTASNLVKLSWADDPLGTGELANYTAAVIHGAIYRARPDINCVMHTHTSAGLAVAALK